MATMQVETGSVPEILIKSTATSGTDSITKFLFKDGNNDGWEIASVPSLTNDPLRIAPITAGTVGTVILHIEDNGNVGIGTTSPGSTLHVGGGVQVGTPTGGDKGTGTINVSGDIYKNNTAYTNPDYVFRHYFEGVGENGYIGMVPLEELEERLKTDKHLPGIARESMGMFARQDVLLEKLEEAYMYITELSRRVKQLEQAVQRSGND